MKVLVQVGDLQIHRLSLRRIGTNYQYIQIKRCKTDRTCLPAAAVINVAGLPSYKKFVRGTGIVGRMTAQSPQLQSARQKFHRF